MARSSPNPQFTAGLLPIVVAVGFVCLIATMSVIVHLRLLGPDRAAYPDHVVAVLSLPFSAVILLGTWRILRHERVTLSEIGLSKSTLLPGAVAFGLFWGLVTAAGVTYLIATGATGDLGVAFEMPWYWVPIWFLLMLTVSNGLTEEFVFRGYIQSKCTALTSTSSNGLAAAVGILTAGVLFGIPHIPLGILLEGASLRAIPFILLNNLIPGIAYGLIYYLTRNLWYTGFVHGFGNATVVPFEPSGIPMFIPIATTVAIVVSLGYRYWAKNTNRVTIRVPEQTGSALE